MVRGLPFRRLPLGEKEMIAMAKIAGWGGNIPDVLTAMVDCDLVYLCRLLSELEESTTTIRAYVDKIKGLRRIK